MRPISFRILGKPDAGELAALHRRGFDTPWNEAAFHDLLELPTSLGIGAMLDNESDLRAFVMFQHVQGDAEILTLVVCPDERRKGVANTLIENGEKHLSARGCTRLFLEVAEDNSPALGLYQKLGFCVEGRRQRYYSRAGLQNVDALIMSRAITGLRT